MSESGVWNRRWGKKKIVVADVAFYFMWLLFQPTTGMSERKPKQMLTCGLECTVAQSWEECWVRNAGSMTSGPQTSLWPTKWRLEEYQGKNRIFKVQVLYFNPLLIQYILYVVSASFKLCLPCFQFIYLHWLWNEKKYLKQLYSQSMLLGEYEFTTLLIHCYLMVTWI